MENHRNFRSRNFQNFHETYRKQKLLQAGGGFFRSAGHAVRQDTRLWHFPIFHLSALSRQKQKALFLLNEESLYLRAVWRYCLHFPVSWVSVCLTRTFQDLFLSVSLSTQSTKRRGSVHVFTLELRSKWLWRSSVLLSLPNESSQRHCLAERCQTLRSGFMCWLVTNGKNTSLTFP